jgi:hypothetical protein
MYKQLLLNSVKYLPEEKTMTYRHFDENLYYVG